MRCTYQSTIFLSRENGFSICRYMTADQSVPPKARDRKSTARKIYFTAKGYNLPTTDVIDYEMTGEWEDSRYGLQLSVRSCQEIVPQTKEGIVGYLGSGLIKGIGPKTAEAIYQTFGNRTMEVLEYHPDELLNIRGISQSKLETIKTSYQESRELRDIVSFLSPYDISVNKAARVLEAFRGKAMTILKTQPFRLCEIRGFGFKTVDSIARAINCHPTDPMRIRGGLLYLMDEADGAGHLFLHREDLVKKAVVLLNDDLPPATVTRNMVEEELDHSLADHKLACEIQRVYKPELWKAEIKVAQKALQMLDSRIHYPALIEKELQKSQSALGITLSEKQAQAVRTWFHSPLSIITGGPGTGKTTTLRVILDIYKRVRPKGEILLAAPTGRASRRMVESTGHSEAFTLHGALGLFGENESGYLGSKAMVEADLVIVDEVSMIDMRLAAELFSRINGTTHLLLVGDPDQLPSVGPGNVLRELIRSELIPTTHLDIAYRQKDAGRIALNAHAVNDGRKGDLIFGEDFSFENAQDAPEAARMVVEAYRKAIEGTDLFNVQILAPFRSRGECSVVKLNEVIQSIINPPDPLKKEIKVGTLVLREMDKVLQTKNRAEVSNGDLGLIASIKKDEDGEDVVNVVFTDARMVSYSMDQLSQLELAYATTIHKSQGSEFSTVIIPILREQYIMLRRNLLYTAVSRAKRKVQLIGQKQALYMAIDRNDADRRNTLLADRIVSYHRQAQAEAIKATA